MDWKCRWLRRLRCMAWASCSATLGLHGLGIAGSLLGRRAVQLAGAGIAATGLALIFAGVSRWTINCNACWKPRPARRR
jgi:hypothetical protein